MNLVAVVLSLMLWGVILGTAVVIGTPAVRVIGASLAIGAS